MLNFMRHLEIHVIETEQDIDLALQAGLLTVEQLDSTECVDCSEPLGHAATDGFEPFSVVIDENDEDWAVCAECSSPVVDGAAIYEDSDSVEYLAETESTDLLDEDEFETF